jgi:hypothetical protein
MTWNVAFSVCWTLVGLLFVVSAGVLLLFTGSLCTWAVEEADSVEVLACAWLFLVTGGATMSLSIVLTQTISYLDSLNDNAELFTPRMYLVHGYLILFISTTLCNSDKLA